jgi:hypothetical protein
MLQEASAESAGAEVSGSGYTVLVTVGLSGWLGGSSETSTTPPPATASRPQAQADAAKPVVSENEDGDLETTFALDLQNAAGGVQVTMQGDPARDPTTVRVLVTWLRSHVTQKDCSPAAFESGAARTELADVQSFSREGFSSSQLTQRGTLPLDVLVGLSDPTQQARLMLCDEPLIILPAAKRRVERFVRAFKRRLSAEVSAQPKG